MTAAYLACPCSDFLLEYTFLPKIVSLPLPITESLTKKY
jgi:hypothetical protein